MDPPPSEPIARGTRPAASAAAEPPLEAPEMRVVSQGFIDSPPTLLWERGHMANSGMLVLPTITAPAARSRAATAPSAAGTKSSKRRDPPVERMPAVHASSFRATGRPCSAPRGSPAATAASARRASSRACAPATVMNACSVGSSASMRSRLASTSSTDDSVPSAIRSRSCQPALHTRSPLELIVDLLGPCPAGG